MVFKALHTIRIKRERVSHYPQNHLVWKILKGKDEARVPARSDYIYRDGNYNEFFIVQTFDGLNFVVKKEDVDVVP